MYHSTCDVQNVKSLSEILRRLACQSSFRQKGKIKQLYISKIALGSM